MSPRQITAKEILSFDDYAKQRKDKRAENMARKRARRVDVGPHASFYFENYDTMLQQIQEMLHIERGGEEQLADELAAYNPLIPQGAELVATLMFEIDNAKKRAEVLYQLGDVELSATLRIGEHSTHSIVGEPEQDIERTTADGKTSSVHFLHFRFPPEALAAAKTENVWTLGFTHKNYAHSTQLAEATRAALLADFD